MACSLCFHDLDEGELENDARSWVQKIKKLMDTSGIKDPKSEGTFMIKGRQLSSDEQRELSECIDELAHWFSYEE